MECDHQVNRINDSKLSTVESRGVSSKINAWHMLPFRSLFMIDLQLPPECGKAYFTLN